MFSGCDSHIFLIIQSLICLNISKYFQVTSIILFLFAAGLIARGNHEFNEAGIILQVSEHVWDINHIIIEISAAGKLPKQTFTRSWWGCNPDKLKCP